LVHNEHNKPKRSSSYFLIIVGALLFMVSPTQYSTNPELSVAGLISGFIIGGIGFYLKFVQGRKARNES
jgi:hypothetical protein